MKTSNKIITDIELCRSEIENKIQDFQRIILEQKQLPISPNEFENLKFKINQDFIDYQNREIINKETKDIRTILYIKAFANNDDFEDYNLITE